MSIYAETYAVWLRKQPPHELSRRQRAQLIEEREWERKNPREVKRLDEFVGKRVVLTKERTTLADEFAGSNAGAPKLVKRGAMFRVFMRVREALLAYDANGVVMSLLPDWVSPMPRIDVPPDEPEAEAVGQ